MDSSIRGSTSDKAKDLFLQTSRYVLGLIYLPPIKQVPTILSPRVRRPDCEACRSPPSSAEDKKERICTLLPPYAFTSHKNAALPLIWAFNKHWSFVPVLSSRGNSGRDDGNDHRSRDTGGSCTDVARNPKPLSDRYHTWNVFQQRIDTSVQNVAAPVCSQHTDWALSIGHLLAYGRRKLCRTGGRGYAVLEVSRAGYLSVLFRPPIRYRYRCSRDSLLACCFQFRPPKQRRRPTGQTDRREHKSVDPTLHGAARERQALVRLRKRCVWETWWRHGVPRHRERERCCCVRHWR